MKTTVVSLGGSLIVPDSIDVGFLKNFRALVLGFIKKNNKIIIVCGGGNVNKKYNTAAKQITDIDDDDLDWLGIACTKLNAELVRCIFSDHAYEKVVNNPTEKIKTNKRIIVASGWEPGHSSDYDSVLLAKNFGSKTIINLTNIDYVYDKDPTKFPDAKPIKEMTWKDYRKIVGDKWTPRLNAPFDPIASKEAERLGIKVMIANGKNLDNLKNILDEKEFIGTLIC
ncbi:MAG: UMP kinase [Candidatus Woesearchaeota archaeon]|nr:UMP kinase [Candidatus Woesearchaeota archaeon]